MTPLQPTRAFSYCDGALDRAAHLRSNGPAIHALRERGQAWVLDATGQVLTDPHGAALLQRPGDASTFLGLDPAGTPWFAQVDETATARPGIDLREAVSAWPAAEVSALAQARALLHWQATHRYCGRCGGAVEFTHAGWQAHCRVCGATHYPRTDAAIIVAVSDGERILLGRQQHWQPATRYSTLAGFVEPGETLEQAVAREVWEETGVRVVQTHYLATQPWPFPASLMVGFIARAEATPPQVDGVELQAAQWFSRAQVRAALAGESDSLHLPPALSISRWLIECWVRA